MAHSTNKVPNKPYKEFPLFAHRNGQWAKKIRGRLHYFGVVADPDAALAKYLEERDYLHAGQEPPRHPAEGVVTVNDLCVQFLESKSNQLEAGELSRYSYTDYLRTCKRLLECFGKATLVASLTPSDFARMRNELTTLRRARGVKNEMVRIRVVFNWGAKSELIGSVKYGPDFTEPSKRTIRQDRQQASHRVLTAPQARALIKYANGNLRAQILLGLNCGWGNHDVATVPLSAVNLQAGLVDFPRPKTAIERRSPLWPETIDALKACLGERRAAADPDDDHLFFLTAKGCRYVRQRDTGAWIDSLGLSFSTLLRKLKIKKRGVGFYCLRHTFRTIADETGDQPAIDRIMGHETPGMGTVYRGWKRDQRENDRLRRITEHVHDWLFGAHHLS